MNIRALLLQIFAVGLLLATGGITYGVLSAENDRREKIEKQIDSLEKIRLSGQTTAFSGECTVVSNVQGSQYRTRLDILRKDRERKVYLVDLKSGKRKKRGSKMRFFGGISGLFQPGKFRKGRLQNCARIVENYRVSFENDVELAGRTGSIVRLSPKSNDRPSYEFVVDRENSFPLRFSVFGDKGDLAYRKSFDSIRFLPGQFLGVSSETRSRSRNWIRIEKKPFRPESSSQIDFPIWVPASPPSGFERTEGVLVTINTTPPSVKIMPNIMPRFAMNLEVVHLLYSDGIALFSLVQFSTDNPIWKMMKSFLPKAESGDGVFTRKISLGMGSAFVLELDGTVVILAGNIWADSLQKTAESLKKIGDPS